jgi:hypothetical protein
MLTQVFQRLPIVGLRDAIDGLPTLEGSGYLAAGSLEGLVELVCDTIDDIELLDAVQNRAFADCVEAFSWSDRARKLSAMLGGSAENVLE